MVQWKCAADCESEMSSLQVLPPLFAQCHSSQGCIWSSKSNLVGGLGGRGGMIFCPLQYLSFGGERVAEDFSLVLLESSGGPR